jgi:hypothetical protein
VRKRWRACGHHINSGRATVVTLHRLVDGGLHRRTQITGVIAVDVAVVAAVSHRDPHTTVGKTLAPKTVLYRVAIVACRHDRSVGTRLIVAATTKTSPEISSDHHPDRTAEMRPALDSSGMVRTLQIALKACLTMVNTLRHHRTLRKTFPTLLPRPSAHRCSLHHRLCRISFLDSFRCNHSLRPLRSSMELSQVAYLHRLLPISVGRLLHHPMWQPCQTTPTISAVTSLATMHRGTTLVMAQM